MNYSKALIALVCTTFLGTSTAFAWNGEGTSTGTCSIAAAPGVEAYGFHPFASWTGHSIEAMAEFHGQWYDDETGEMGIFYGRWVDDPSIPPTPTDYKISEGVWTRTVSGQDIVMGTYYLKCEVTNVGSATGSWRATHSGWTGYGTLTGQDYIFPEEGK
jgi:hypothetical protein